MYIHESICLCGYIKMEESDGGVANVYTLSSRTERSREKPKRKMKENDRKSSIKSAKGKKKQKQKQQIRRDMI